ncbi:hypothetical protein M407DRAFT_240476 [Tulasnella calospora MUT 4182]|uniref:Uncharacterized protein n=1 Tax=Tulasnella calospora MUT 4182 TaxID=1051891 RepID=A0A0C3QX66_9AGAM|nr:hypothetical protein M407DRAFT_240476 [Tulasnella calospora MUT 4182]
MCHFGFENHPGQEWRVRLTHGSRCSVQVFTKMYSKAKRRAQRSEVPSSSCTAKLWQEGGIRTINKYSGARQNRMTKIPKGERSRA